MKKIENLLLRACGYTIIIMAIFYAVAMIGKFTSASLTFGRFALLFTFGLIISAAGLLLTVNRIKLPLRILIHYAILLAAFCFVFILSGNLGTSSSVAFTAVVVFTFLYATVFAIAYSVKRAVSALDKAVDKNVKITAKTAKTKEYTPLYKD